MSSTEPLASPASQVSRIGAVVVSGNAEDNRTPLRNAKVDAVANLDGAWQLSFRDLKPAFIGLLCEAIAYLDEHNTDFMHQLGGARNFGAGIVDVDLINPLYTETELVRRFDRSKQPMTRMAENDDAWTSEYHPEFTETLEGRIEEGPYMGDSTPNTRSMPTSDEDALARAYRHDTHKLPGQHHKHASETFADVPVNQPVPRDADGDAACRAGPWANPPIRSTPTRRTIDSRS